jgi:shikimate kinase
LIGYRGSGKTSIGKLVARLLGMEYVDTDIQIQERAGCSIREIFADQGEEAFRDLETRALADLLASKELPPTLIATGGGIIMRPENREMIKKMGMVIWLAVSPEVATARITADSFSDEQRPPLSDQSLAEEVERMIALRTPLYSELADVHVANDSARLSTDAVAEAVIEMLRQTDWYIAFEKRLDS